MIVDQVSLQEILHLDHLIIRHLTVLEEFMPVELNLVEHQHHRDHREGMDRCQRVRNLSRSSGGERLIQWKRVALPTRLVEVETAADPDMQKGMMQQPAFETRMWTTTA